MLTPLYMLLNQTGKIRAYKLVGPTMVGAHRGGVKYEVGKIAKGTPANTDEKTQYGAGINLATLDWCLKEYSPDCHILLCEFTKRDIACIPIGSDGKFRVHKCRVVRKMRLSEVGLT